MHRLSSRFLVRPLTAMLAVLAVLFAPASALAAAGPWNSVEVTLIQSDGQPVLLVAGTLPADAKLPAKVSLAMPSGAQVSWAGEIVGQDPSKDPQVQYQVKKGDASDIVEFTVTQSRTAQIEAAVPQAVTKSGNATTASIDWVAPFDVPSATLRLQLPAGAQVSDASQDASTTASSAATFVTRSFGPVKTGDALELKATYTAGSPTGGTGGTGATTGGQTGATGTGGIGGVDPVIIGIITVLVISGVAIYLMRRQQLAAQASEDEEYDEEDEYGEAETDQDEGAVDPEDFDAFQDEDADR